MVCVAQEIEVLDQRMECWIDHSLVSRVVLSNVNATSNVIGISQFSFWEMQTEIDRENEIENEVANPIGNEIASFFDHLASMVTSNGDFHHANRDCRDCREYCREYHEYIECHGCHVDNLDLDDLDGLDHFDNFDHNPDCREDHRKH